ncbi:Sushi, von Willebrand factor type A, EGF and pentraxin domain-containing protein 1 [Chionoecetes opilio]|uniref:Sushi, von Willebrand factor type A, EGF and pentraxin domain-containing protein 1 n=1 Tax=Chionoecetes opilio TaxID=41210 RepID=A0A8J4XWI5_CHIOP|nr:Sushi, von Willebrand factor type A, EGF and pentraxin domain-containing protein 1 [Chionoecetes opilio]
MGVDGNADTCSFTPRGPDPRWWQVHLGHKFNVITVGVTISPGSVQEFTIYVIELLTDNKALYKPCTTFKGVFQTHKAIFHCNDGLGHPGQFVYIRDDREDQEYFGLCEVEVFAFRERIPCGEPEVPVEGEVEREGEGKAVYTCRPGFRLEGDEVLTCSSKGKWQGQSPRCKESQCPTPAQVPNGFMEVANFRGVYGHGTVVTYSCSPGYKLEGAASHTCDHTGAWSKDPPVCKAVTCGPPPVFPNARHILLNSSTSWNGIAVYTCMDGYKLHTDTKDTVTTCLEEGQWRPVNVTCVPVLPPSPPLAGLREGEGRALSFDLTQLPQGEAGGTQGLVVALAVVAGLLTAAMLVVGTLLARRHLSSTSGSLRSLVKNSHSKESAMNGGIVGPQHPTSFSPNGSSVTLGPDAEDPGTGDTLRSSLYQQNLLNLPLHPHPHMTSITESELDDDPNYAHIGHEPSYERVGNRSEHSYETLRKKSIASDAESDGESTRDDQQGKDSDGYESVSKGREPSYEAVEGIITDHNYEPSRTRTLGMRSESQASSTSTSTPASPSFPEPETVPDILQDLADVSGEEGIPPEIQALYARVDKSKKKRRRVLTSQQERGEERPPPPTPPQSPVSHVSTSSSTLSSPSTKDAFHTDRGSEEVSGPPSATKDLIRKFNRLNSEEEMQALPRSRQGSVASDTGSLRPLPPLPGSPHQSPRPSPPPASPPSPHTLLATHQPQSSHPASPPPAPVPTPC